MGAAEIVQAWFTEPEAAVYCRCCVTKFRQMRITAKDSGGRKVYSRRSLDSALEARPWQRSTKEADASTSTGGKRGSSTVGPLANLKGERLKDFAPRKKRSSTG